MNRPLKPEELLESPPPERCRDTSDMFDDGAPSFKRVTLPVSLNDRQLRQAVALLRDADKAGDKNYQTTVRQIWQIIQDNKES